jgi:hypothetical protein
VKTGDVINTYFPDGKNGAKAILIGKYDDQDLSELIDANDISREITETEMEKWEIEIIGYPGTSSRWVHPKDICDNF